MCVFLDLAQAVSWDQGIDDRPLPASIIAPAHCANGNLCPPIRPSFYRSSQAHDESRVFGERQRRFSTVLVNTWSGQGASTSWNVSTLE